MKCDRFAQESENQVFIVFKLHWLQQLVAFDTLKVKEELFLSKEFTLETIVQVARSLGTKSLDTNWIFSLRGFSVNVVFINNSPQAT